MDVDDLVESLHILEGGTASFMDFEDHLISCFDSAQNGPSAFSFSTSICDPYADTAELVPSTVGEVADYNDECDNLLPTIQQVRYDLLLYKYRIERCKTLELYLMKELERACEPLASQIMHVMAMV